MAKESASARFLYNTAAGRLILKGAVQPWVSRAAGAFLSSPLSKPIIPGFVKKNGIDLSECENEDFSCFNDCFTRKLRKELRPIDMDPRALISPCDGLLSAYRIRDGLVMPVKQSMYSVADLLGEGPQGDLAKKFNGGLCLVFRLQVTDYHRYVFFDGGEITKTYSIPGRLHTVRPIALRTVPVFTENAREITIIESDSFDTAAQIEVGALMVGRIENCPVSGRAEKGAEKGRFLFGGSTIILLLEKDRAEGLSEALKATSEGIETPVKLGQRIGSGPSAPSSLQLS